MARPAYGRKKRKKPATVRETAVADVVEPDTARLFWNGRSQAVRLPKAFRFEGEAVRIRRSGESVILEPLKRRGWPPGFWESFGKVGEDFERAVLEARSKHMSEPPDFDALP